MIEKQAGKVSGVEQVAATNGREICYQTFGSDGDPPVVLVMGLTAQMVGWHEDLCRDLAGRGHHVIRFDNRDVGRSSKTDGPPPNMVALVTKVMSGQSVDRADVPYDLSDMAADTVGLLDALGIERAHLVGASMGGMIVQHLCFDHPDRVRTATSIMSTTGAPDVGQAAPEVLSALMQPAPAERDAFAEHAVDLGRVISGPHFSPDEARSRAARSYDRGHHPEAAAFQMAAIMASGDRTGRLASVTAPFGVIHGAVDPLISPSGGEATAAAIDGATLMTIDEMGTTCPARCGRPSSRPSRPRSPEIASTGATRSGGVRTPRLAQRPPAPISPMPGRPVPGRPMPGWPVPGWQPVSRR